MQLLTTWLDVLRVADYTYALDRGLLFCAGCSVAGIVALLAGLVAIGLALARVGRGAVGLCAFVSLGLGVVGVYAGATNYLTIYRVLGSPTDKDLSHATGAIVGSVVLGGAGFVIALLALPFAGARGAEDAG